MIFFHDPIWDHMLNVTEPTHPNVQLTPEDYAASHEMIDLINNHPLIVASIAGHGHVEAEKVVGKNRAFMTPGLYRGACRLIVGGEVKFACVDGPEFDGHKVDFAELMSRNGTYTCREKEVTETHACRMEAMGKALIK